jgi:S-formylglutathione hydrolase FrmB
MTIFVWGIYPKFGEVSMQRNRLTLLCAVFLFCVTALAHSEACSDTPHPRFSISVDAGLTSQPVSGRLLVIMSTTLGSGNRLTPTYGPEAHSVWVAAKEIRGLTPQQPVTLDPDELAYPEPFCNAPSGTYHIKAVLDINHDFAYDYDATAGDLLSQVVDHPFNPASADLISLSLTERKIDPVAPVPPQCELIDFASPALSAFWGRSIHMTGLVVLPPSYSGGSSHYPTVYSTHGFGGNLRGFELRTAPNLIKLMAEKKIPEMIWVLLVEAFPTGTHEFADSVNNGPWGKALTTELIPALERKYRMDAKPNGRFLTGHSSGGWASLWLQVVYPDLFGGTWPTAPDPSDFRSFSRIDLTQRPPGNFYYDHDGSPHMLIRMGGKDVQSSADLAHQERVLGEYGGQIASFNWVFSPRGKDGRPMPFFDPVTGRIDPEVTDYWEAHYDIANILRENWKQIGPKVDGKIHLTVGTADTIYLNESAQLLEQTIKSLGGKADFTYMDGRSHFDLYQGDLMERIARQMYAIARPGR